MNPALLGAAASVGSTIVGAYNSHLTAKNADRNYQNQLNMQRYNEALQQQIFAREDTAYQRTAKDMRAAGLSPLTMNGTNSAGEAIAMDAPQRENPDFSTTINSLFSIANMMNELKSRQLQNQNMELQNRYLADSMESRLNQSSYSAESTRLSNIMSEYLNADKKRQEQFNSFFNINDGMSEMERAASFALKALGKGYKDVDSFGDHLKPILDKSINTVNGFLDTLNGFSDKIGEFFDKLNGFSDGFFGIGSKFDDAKEKFFEKAGNLKDKIFKKGNKK